MNKTDYIFGLRAIIEAIEAGKVLTRCLSRKTFQEIFRENYSAR